jgi:hypothetical protein
MDSPCRRLPPRRPLRRPPRPHPRPAPHPRPPPHPRRRLLTHGAPRRPRTARSAACGGGGSARARPTTSLPLAPPPCGPRGFPRCGGRASGCARTRPAAGWRVRCGPGSSRRPSNARCLHPHHLHPTLPPAVGVGVGGEARGGVAGRAAAAADPLCPPSPPRLRPELVFKSPRGRPPAPISSAATVENGAASAGSSFPFQLTPRYHGDRGDALVLYPPVPPPPLARPGWFSYLPRAIGFSRATRCRASGVAEALSAPGYLRMHVRHHEPTPSGGGSVRPLRTQCGGFAGHNAPSPP